MRWPTRGGAGPQKSGGVAAVVSFCALAAVAVDVSAYFVAEFPVPRGAL